MKRFSIFCTLVCIIWFSNQGNAQQMTFKTATDSMSIWMKRAEQEPSIAKKQALVNQFSELFEKTLKKADAFSYHFDSIPHLGKLVSPDGKLRVFTWAVPTAQAGVFLYGGILQHKRLLKDNPLSDVFVLEDAKDQLIVPESESLSYPYWYGCLYYQIIEKTENNQSIYTLLGFDFNNNITRKKLIDVLYFDAQGFPQFGLPLFLEEKTGLKSRIIFEYSSQSVMFLKYYPELDRIVFNYLYPIVSERKDDRRYYVPDVTYDAFEYKFGKWMKVSNINFRSPEM